MQNLFVTHNSLKEKRKQFSFQVRKLPCMVAWVKFLLTRCGKASGYLQPFHNCSFSDYTTKQMYWFAHFSHLKLALPPVLILQTHNYKRISMSFHKYEEQNTLNCKTSERINHGRIKIVRRDLLDLTSISFCPESCISVANQRLLGSYKAVFRNTHTEHRNAIQPTKLVIINGSYIHKNWQYFLKAINMSGRHHIQLP